jgi:hypothetical protein
VTPPSLKRAGGQSEEFGGIFLGDEGVRLKRNGARHAGDRESVSLSLSTRICLGLMQTTSATSRQCRMD